jgi:hypothetical protein
MATVRLRNPPKDIFTKLKQCPALQEQGKTWHMDKAIFVLVQQMAEKEKANQDGRPATKR